MAATGVTPPQSLLSTIYKQSWHPIASTKPHYQHTILRPGILHNDLQNSHNNSASKRHAPEKSHKQKENSSSRLGIRRGLEWTSPTRRRSIGERSARSNIVAEEESSEEYRIPSLGNWRRKLRTCVESNQRPEYSKPPSTSNTSNMYNRDSRSSSQVLRRQTSWSTDSSTTCYRVLNYQNSTLASIRVVGRDPPSKRRSINVVKSQSSPLPIPVTSLRNPVFNGTLGASALEREVARSKEARAESNCSRSFSDMDMETTEDAATIDEVFTSSSDKSKSLYSDNNEVEEEKNSDKDHVCEEDSDDVMPALDLMKLNFNSGVNRNDLTSMISESDISDQEMTSDEEAEVTNNELSRCVVEKYKQLYERENMLTAQIADAQDNDVVLNNSTDQLNKECDNDFDVILDDNCYDFASVLPKNLEKYDLNKLSKLPSCVNWRTVVKMSELRVNKRPKSHRKRRARSARAPEEPGSLELMMDKLITLEKLQTVTKQREAMRRYHTMHVRAEIARAKQVRRLSSSVIMETKTTDAPGTENLPSARAPSRRRASVSSMSSRTVWVNEVSQSEQILLQEACKNGNIALLHDNWRNRTKSRCSSDSARRNSESSKSIARFRQRLNIPRFYDYRWSERIKEEKFKLSSAWERRIRSCPTCREKVKKLNHDLTQERRQQLSIIECNDVNHRHTSDKLQINQSSSNEATHITVTTDSTATSNGWKLYSKVPPDKRKAASKSTEKCVVIEHQETPRNAHEEIRRSNVRNKYDDFFTSAFRISSAPFGNRSVKSFVKQQHQC